MKWFNRWFAKKCQQAWEEARGLSQPETLATPAKMGRGINTTLDSDDGLNIQVRAAIGGKIVSFRHYDQKSDRNYWKTYVIPEELDFERELGKMITLESMRG